MYKCHPKPRTTAARIRILDSRLPKPLLLRVGPASHRTTWQPQRQPRQPSPPPLSRCHSSTRLPSTWTLLEWNQIRPELLRYSATLSPKIFFQYRTMKPPHLDSTPYVFYFLQRFLLNSSRIPTATIKYYFPHLFIVYY